MNRLKAFAALLLVLACNAPGPRPIEQAGQNHRAISARRRDDIVTRLVAQN